MNTETPAVVLKLAPELFHHGGLAVVRTLGRLGVPVYGVHDMPRAPAALSRYAAGKFVYREGDDPLQFLREVASTIGTRPLLVPQDDLATLFVDSHADELRELFLFPEQPNGLARRLANKRKLAELCAQLDIPTPHVAFPRTRADVAAFSDELSLPVVIKPTESFIPETGQRGRLVVAHTREQLFTEWDDMSDAERSNTMLQEYVPGGPESVWMFNGYFDASSECLAGFTGCKLHESPPAAGVTSLGVCADNGVVSEMTRRLVKEIGYRGVVDLDYRFDERDGKYKLLDANPRVGATFRLFVDSDTGVDVVRALYLDLTRQPVPPVQTPVGRKWLLDPWDVKTCLAYRRDGRLTLRGWARSYRGVEELAWFAPGDPLPFFALTAHVLAKRFRRAP